MVHGVMENDGRQKWEPLRPQLSPRDLDRYLGHLAQCYTFVSLDEAIEGLAGRAPMRPNSLVLTFDDGYRNNLSHALPILRKYGAPATIFVATGHVDRHEPFWFDRLDYALQHGLAEPRRFQVGSQVVQMSGRDRDDLAESYGRLRDLAKREMVDDERFHELMNSLSLELEMNGGTALADICDDDDWSAVATWEQIAKASGDGVIFGSHTVKHIRLSYVSHETVRAQMEQSKRAIEQHVDQPCRYLAYPNGDFNEAVVAIAREVGYAAAVTIQEGLNKRGDDLLSLRRINLSVGLSKLELYAHLSGFSDVRARIKTGLFEVLRAVRGTIYRVLKGRRVL
jgi:peptidoglycan/xylan/chitin deacetylase (PgdA/CDA1 family)